MLILPMKRFQKKEPSQLSSDRYVVSVTLSLTLNVQWKSQSAEHESLVTFLAGRP